MPYIINGGESVYSTSEGTTHPTMVALMTKIQLFVDTHRASPNKKIAKAFSLISRQHLTKTQYGWLNLVFDKSATKTQMKLVAKLLNDNELTYNLFQWGKSYTSPSNKFKSPYIALGRRAANFSYGTGIRQNAFRASALKMSFHPEKRFVSNAKTGVGLRTFKK